MDYALIGMGGVVIAAFLIAYFSQGWPLIQSGLITSAGKFKFVWFRMVLGLLLGGMIQVLISPAVVHQWMGAGSGFRGVLVGTVAGIFTPGGPYVHFPLLAALQNKGASVGPLAAFMTSWALIPLYRTFVFEIPFMRIEFALCRLAASLLVPIFIGFTTPALMGIFSRFFVRQ
jgi:uncharacterized membrane protein YraQ (UPF0718 family)